MKKVTRILLGVGSFYLLALIIFLLLRWKVHDIASPAPDALHLIGFVALLPMIGAAGGKFANRKIAYMKNDKIFKPIVIGTFIVTYLSLVPWVLSFFVADDIFVYIDWSVVLAAAFLSFVIFSLFLYVFIKD